MRARELITGSSEKILAMRILVTGGVRSGKSTHAESLIGDEAATYVAAGPTPDTEADPDWTARIAAHRARRPASWTTRETQDLALAVREAGQPVLGAQRLGERVGRVVEDVERPSKVSRRRHARRNVSCTVSSASSNDPSIR